MANLATVHAFRRESLRVQRVPVLGAVHSGLRDSPRFGPSLGDILETAGGEPGASLSHVSPRDGARVSSFRRGPRESARVDAERHRAWRRRLGWSMLYAGVDVRRYRDSGIRIRLDRRR